MIEDAQRGKSSKKDIDAMVKIPGPKPLGDDIDMGFSRLKICQEDDSVYEKSHHSDSDNHEEMVPYAKNFLDFDSPIRLIVATKKNTEYARIAVLFDSKFSIYDIWEELSTGVEYMHRHTCHFKTDPITRNLGKVTYIDFEVDGKHFVTSTNLGWVNIWELKTFDCCQKFRVINPLSSRPENITQIRDVNKKRYFVTYSHISECILVTDILDRSDDNVTGKELINLMDPDPQSTTVLLFKCEN
jgi:hypothetical protein